jgi:alpha-L-fucosidase 2
MMLSSHPLPRWLIVGLGFIGALNAAEMEFAQPASAPSEPLSLWYRGPAHEWTEALPVGNGRLGAMVFGGINRERVQLNEGTLWAGGPYDQVSPEAKAALPEVRRLIFAGNYAAAENLISAKVLARPLQQLPYETAGDLYLDFPAATAVARYRRSLDLDTAVATTTYSIGGVTYTREVFSSAADQVMVVHLTADQPGRISFTASLATPQKASTTTESGDTLVTRGVNGDASGIKGALQFQSRVKVLAAGGTTRAKAGTIAVTQADSATLLIAIATSFRNYHDVSGDPAALTRTALAAALARPPESYARGPDRWYQALRSRHVADYRRLFRRVAVDLGATAAAARPTNERIAHFGERGDPQLAALYYQFGRYLLISSSRPGGQPSTLQGLWNDSMTPPWESKYTININTEMNYWPAETSNLGECVEPLEALIEDLSHTGARTAREMYGARGWVAHHNTDLWRSAAPIDGPWGLWPMGGAWLCQTLWEHYRFNPDPVYLQRIYPLLKGSAEFFLDTLVPDPSTGWLVTNPSMSPEHAHPGGQTIAAGPTMDLEMLRDLFAECITASEVLGTDADFRGRVAAARSRLAPLRIGQAGQLQEWQEDWDLAAPDIHHRHVSHLYGLYPSAQIGPQTTPLLAAAVQRSLEIRGDQTTGWGSAWRINLWARLHDGNHAYKVLEMLLSPELSYPDLLDSCPPFQIDGNFGAVAGINEMLLQSQNGAIEFLPALPSAWADGSFRGLRARGGFQVDCAWHDGKMISATVHAITGRVAHLIYGSASRVITLAPGQSFQWDGR